MKNLLSGSSKNKLSAESEGWHQFNTFTSVQQMTSKPDPAVSHAEHLHTMCRARDKHSVSDGISTVKNKQCKDGRVEREPVWRQSVHSVKAPAKTRFWPVRFRIGILAQMNAYLTTKNGNKWFCLALRTETAFFFFFGWIFMIMPSFFLIKAKKACALLGCTTFSTYHQETGSFFLWSICDTQPIRTCWWSATTTIIISRECLDWPSNVVMRPAVCFNHDLIRCAGVQSLRFYEVTWCTDRWTANLVSDE